MPNNARRSLEQKLQGSVRHAKDRGAESAVRRCFVPGPEELGRLAPETRKSIRAIDSGRQAMEVVAGGVIFVVYLVALILVLCLRR
jgi:hypothetical protein